MIDSIDKAFPMPQIYHLCNTYTLCMLDSNTFCIVPHIDLKQVIPANATPKTVSGSASATTINFHISGVEIS